MDRKTLKTLLDGTFELAFPACELRQRGTHEPEVFLGGGFLSQDEHGRLILRMVAGGHRSVGEAVKRQLLPHAQVGKLFPETAYYDLRCETSTGEEWRAERVCPSFCYGPRGTSARIRISHIEHQRELSKSLKKGVASTFIAGNVDLPWHVWTATGELSGALDQFKHETERFAWGAKREEGGVRLQFSAVGVPIERAFSSFLRAHSIGIGRVVDAPTYTFSQESSEIERLATQNTEVASLRLLPPFGRSRDDAAALHAFLVAYLERATTSRDDDGREEEGAFCDSVYAAWYRVLRARQGDLDNYALVLGVMVEGLISKLFSTEHDPDPGFLAQVQDAKEAINRLSLSSRARDCILSSLGNAVKVRPVDVLRRLVDQGAVGEVHLKAWRAMRHSAAHGGKEMEDEFEWQGLLDQIHACLDLLYRLLFVLTGYRGNHIDYSSEGWPSVVFPAVEPFAAPQDHQ